MPSKSFHPEIRIGEDDNLIYFCRVESAGNLIIHREYDVETHQSRNVLRYTVPYKFIRQAGEILTYLAKQSDGKILRDAFENPMQPLCAECQAHCPILYLQSFKRVITA